MYIVGRPGRREIFIANKNELGFVGKWRDGFCIRTQITTQIIGQSVLLRKEKYSVTIFLHEASSVPIFSWFFLVAQQNTSSLLLSELSDLEYSK